VDDTVTLLSRQFLSGIELTLEMDRLAPPVIGARTRLEQMLLNLIVNASEAMNGVGKLLICVRPHVLPENATLLLHPRPAQTYVELTVRDSGPGIEPAIVGRIFEPFFTTKTHGATRGTGLGLSMVYTMALQDGLGLQVETNPGAGAAFRIVLPVA
jgi:signal transduction histidine kinase